MSKELRIFNMSDRDKNVLSVFAGGKWIQITGEHARFLIEREDKMQAALKEREWRPISEAPKDGTEILASTFSQAFQSWIHVVVYWTDDYGDRYKWIGPSNSGTDDLFHGDYFTHFQYLTAPEGE